MQRPLSPWVSLAWDLGPSVVLFLVGVLTMDTRDPREPLAYFLVAAPLAFRRVSPLGVLAAVSLFAVLTSIDISAPWVDVAAVAFASFTAGESATDGRSRRSP
jgi:hypothetical protein